MSVLFGLGDPDTVRAVRAAHDRSVDAALGWLECEACMSRRGVDGFEQIAGEGFAAAGFVHRTSRAGDPQLHTHVLVANLTRCDDGLWRTLHGGPVFWQARTAGYLYKAQLRHELTESLGVAWGPVRKGAAEIVDIPPELCALFSTRRHEIQDELNARGEHSSRAARVAALETRQAKDYGVDIGALRDRWHDQALEAGHAPETITAIGQTESAPITADDEHAANGRVVGSARPYRTGHDIRSPDRAARLVRTTPRRRAHHDDRGTRRSHPRRRTCDRPPGPRPLPEVLDRRARRARTTPRRPGARRDRHRRRCRRRTASPHGARRPTGTLTGTGRLHRCDHHLRQRCRRHRCRGRDRQDVLPRRRGRRLAPRRLPGHWRRARRDRRRATPNPNRIGSDTIALRTLQLANGTLGFDRQTVVVIDEAAMASTRGLVPLLDAAHDAGAKLVMVGDPRQLDAIDAGGLLNGLAHRLPPITLTENRRQQHAWERDALADLRAGRIADALDGYNTHDRVIVADTAIDVRNHMAADWHAATLAGDHVLMLAERHYDVDDLNQRARQHLTRNGTITGPALDIDDLTFQAGDRVLCVRNDRRIGVRNGTIGTVTDLDPEKRSITIRTDGHTTHELPARYLDAGHVRDRLRCPPSTKAKGSPSIVASSSPATPSTAKPATPRLRGRNDNRIYLVAQPPTDPETHHPERDTPDPNTNSRRRSNPTVANDSRSITTSTPTPSAKTSNSSTRGRARLEANRLALPDRKADIRALQDERHQLNNTAEREQRFLDTKRPGTPSPEHNIARTRGRTRP